MALVFVLWLFAGDHHGFGFSRSGEGEVAGSGCLALMLVLYMGVEGGITQVPFAADTDVVALHGVVSRPSLPSRLELLLTFVVADLLGVAHRWFIIIEGGVNVGIQK